MRARYAPDLPLALDGLSFQAWRCTAMTISREAGGLRQALPLTPTELAALRAADSRAAP